MPNLDYIRLLWRPSGRGKAQCAPNPDYPEGIHVDITEGKLPYCLVEPPYPAPECGLWLIECDRCEYSLAITAAGRPDDPRTVRIPCNREFTYAPD